jgi:hypothetical protein
MKKQASDQQSHDRRYQERKRAEAARQPAKKKTVVGGTPATGSVTKAEKNEPRR